MRKLLAKLFLFATLEIGALCGVPISAEQIERLMELMNRTEIVQVVKKDDPHK